MSKTVIEFAVAQALEEMAREVGANEVGEIDSQCSISSIGLMAFETHELEAFAELVRADAIASEREACEMAIEELPPDADRGDCAAAIRARSNT